MTSNLHDIRSRSGENAQMTRVERAWYAPPQMGGGGSRRKRRRDGFSAFRAILGDRWPRRIAAPSFRVFHPCRNVPASCRDILSHDKTFLKIAGAKTTCSETPFRAEKTQKQAKRRKTWHYHQPPALVRRDHEHLQGGRHAKREGRAPVASPPVKQTSTNQTSARVGNKRKRRSP